MIVGKLVWLQEEVRKEDISIALISREESFTSDLFKDTLDSNLIDPTLQDNVVIGTGIFLYIYHVGCTFNLHSIINNGLVLEGQNLSRRQTVFFLLVDPRDGQITKILNILTSLYHVERDTCTVHGKCTKTRYSGFILILRSEKD